LAFSGEKVPPTRSVPLLAFAVLIWNLVQFQTHKPVQLDDKNKPIPEYLWLLKQRKAEGEKAERQEPGEESSSSWLIEEIKKKERVCLSVLSSYQHTSEEMNLMKLKHMFEAWKKLEASGREERRRKKL